MIIVTGSLAYDQIFNLPKQFSDYILPEWIHQINVSFITETHQKSFGGTAGNQAYALSQLGVGSSILASVGSDFTSYQSFLEQNNVDTSGILVFQKSLTATGCAITDTKDNQIWGFSVAAMKYAKRAEILKYLQKKKIKKEDVKLVLVAPNDHRAMTVYVDECVKMGIPFAFDPAFYIPNIEINVLKKGVRNAKILFGNDYESALLAKKIGVKKIIPAEGQIVVTTFGEKGSVVETVNKGKIKSITISSAKPTKFVDPTGAGDAYRGGFVAGYLANKSLEQCGKMGAVSASFAIEHYGTMNYRFTQKEFLSRYNHLA